MSELSFEQMLEDSVKTIRNGEIEMCIRDSVDTVIAPADTRKYVIGAFEMLFTKREDRPSKKHGTV